MVIALLVSGGILPRRLTEDLRLCPCNDLSTLLVGWLLARARSVPLIYDAHEMWSENVSYNGRSGFPCLFGYGRWHGTLRIFSPIRGSSDHREPLNLHGDSETLQGCTGTLFTCQLS